MLGGAVKLLLVATSFAPIFLTVAFIFATQGRWIVAGGWCVGAIVCALACSLTIRASQRKLESFPFEITSIRTADKEIVGFVLAYLLPLANIGPFKQDLVVLSFVLAVFLMVVMTTNSYHFNPLLGLLGYHFYEATSGNVSYVLVSRKNLRNTATIKQVVQLTEYMVIDVDKKGTV